MGGDKKVPVFGMVERKGQRGGLRGAEHPHGNAEAPTWTPTLTGTVVYDRRSEVYGGLAKRAG